MAKPLLVSLLGGGLGRGLGLGVVVAGGGGRGATNECWSLGTTRWRIALPLDHGPCIETEHLPLLSSWPCVTHGDTKGGEEQRRERLALTSTPPPQKIKSQIE